MYSFMYAVAAKTDEPLMFRKGESTYIEGLGEVHQDYMLLSLPQTLEDDEIEPDESCVDCD
jgi:hypothetical protein